MTQPTKTRPTVEFPPALWDLPNRDYWESLSNNQLLQWLQVILPFYRDTTYLSDELEYLGYEEDLQIRENFTDKQLDRLDGLGEKSRAELLAWLIAKINLQEILESVS